MGKKNKRIFMLFLSLCLILSCTAVSFAENAKIIVNAPSDLPKAGDSFKVKVDISGNPGISAVQFTLAYDEDLMKCTDAEVGKLLSGTLCASNHDGRKGAIVAAASSENISDDGSLGVFEFTALKDIESYNFVICDAIFADSEGNKISFDTQGTVYSVNENGDDKNSGSNNDKANKSDTVSDNSDKKVSTDSDSKTNSDSNEYADTSYETVNVVTGFTDTANHWAREYIEKAAMNGIFKGNSDGTFKPDDSITRAQFVTVLYRMSGSPNVNVSTPFTDTENVISEFKNAIAWAYSKGYINGTSETTFSPDAALTRQEAMKILHYYNNGGISGMESMFTEGYEKGYSDSDSIAACAKPSVYWGVYNGLISGNPDGTMAPKGSATRAQLAKILINYIDKFM